MNTNTKTNTIPSTGGWVWLPCYVGRDAMDMRPEKVDPLPEGFTWGKSGGRWVPVFDQAAC